jgi:hypothetical protein
MFTQRDKIKELTEYLVKNNSETQCLVFRNHNYKPVGVSEVITCEYSIENIRVVYNEWFVEGFELASKMKLPGTDHHGNLVKGSGVTVSTKYKGQFTFYGKDALAIKEACEINRDLGSYLTSMASR